MPNPSGWRSKENALTLNKEIHQVCICLGSNIEPIRNIREALEILGRHVLIIRQASIWESPPYQSRGANFLNTAVWVQTSLNETRLKDLVLRNIESELGRARTADKYAPRTIDLDIVTYDDQVLDDDLWSLAFMAIPISEIHPELVQPETGKTILQIADRLSQQQKISIFPDLRT